MKTKFYLIYFIIVFVLSFLFNMAWDYKHHQSYEYAVNIIVALFGGVLVTLHMHAFHKVTEIKP
jgi:uncharacterized membrane protein